MLQPFPLEIQLEKYWYVWTNTFCQVLLFLSYFIAFTHLTCLDKGFFGSVLLDIHSFAECIVLFSHQLLSVFPHFGVDGSVKSSILLSMMFVYLIYLIIHIFVCSVLFLSTSVLLPNLFAIISVLAKRREEEDVPDRGVFWL